nr:PREDICTED: dentin sialophosphoprotein-like [Pundamilia nyererei]
MSSHRRHFHCFDAVGGEGIHRSSIPFKRHSTRLPRIPQHGMVAHHEPTAECYVCSECRHAHALEAVETQLSPFYHTHPSCHHHHPHHYVLSGPSRPEETPLGHERHHHRYSKKLVLVKNSDPSFRKTIILHRRGLRSLGLFLEEVSELMQYHIRKLYTVGGHKIDSVQSLLQCPGVLVCVGREPSHPLIVENFRKTSDDKLPKLSVRSRSGGCTDGHERKSKVLEQVADKADPAQRSPSVLSVKSNTSGRTKKSNISGTTATETVGHEEEADDSAMINGDLDTKESGGSVTDKKTDGSSKYLHKSTEVDDFDLVPSSLPNASPTEVVNEWLKSLPAEDDDFNHTSSSGVDVNSGSTGSGNSSDGVKSGNDVNGDVSEPHATVDMFKKMIMQMRIRKDQLMKADGSDATADEQLNGPTEEDESEDTEASSEDKSKEDVAEGTMVQDEDTHVAGATAEQNPMPEESKSGRFKVKKRVHMMQEEAVNEDLAIVDEFLKEEEEAWCKGKLTAENETASLSEDESDEESAEDTTTEDENTAVEATTEGKDEVWEEKILPEEEKMSTVSEDESADESTDTATGDESTEEPGDPATTEDETAAEKETGLAGKAESKHENAEDEIENKDTAMVSSTDHESESEEAVESLKVDDGEETDATSEDDSDEDLNATTNEEEEENDVTSNDLSNEPSEIATTEDEFLVERETAATSEHELTEGTYEASTAEDENVAVESSMVATSERESEEDEVVEKGTVTDEEKIPAISAEESEGENNHTNKLSEEPDRAASAEDKTAVSEEISSAGKGDSKDETAVEATDNEEAVKAEDADNSEEIGAVTENDSGEDLDATTNEDETTEEDDTTEPAEETTEDERVIETEIAVSTENEPNRGAAAEENVEGTTSDNEAEDYGAAEEAATTEHDSDTAVAVDTASASESESEDEVSEAKESAVTSEDELKKAAVEVAQEEAAEDVTDAEHEFNKDTSSDESDVKGTDEKLSEGEIAEQKEIAATSENEMAEEADETSDESDKTESSEKIGESSANEECKEEENDEDNSKKLVEGETTGDESEEPGKEEVESGENELTCEDCTEALTTEGETEKHETTEEDSGQPEAGENETDESDSREESGAEGTSAGEEAEETQTGKVESTDDTEDESEQDEGQNAVSESEDNSNKPESGCPESDVTCQEDTNDVVELKPEEDEEMEEKSETKEEIRENNPEDDVTQCECINIPDGSHDNNEEDSNASEKEDEETETPNEDWSEKQGDSADGEDEAEEDSDEPEEESGDIQLPLVTSKIDNQDVANIVPKEALKPLDTLIKKTAESEDGTYADIEDSEPEINSQKP